MRSERPEDVLVCLNDLRIRAVESVRKPCDFLLQCRLSEQAAVILNVGRRLAVAETEERKLGIVGEELIGQVPQRRRCGDGKELAAKAMIRVEVRACSLA